MRKFSFLFALLIITACTKNNSVEFLKTSQVQLVQPTLELSNQLIDSFVVLRAELAYPNTEIRYTTDNSEPNQNSKLYTSKFKIDSPSTFKFKAFHSKLLTSETVVTSIKKKGLSIDKIEWISSASHQYNGSGENTLTNHEKGSLNFGDKQWLGFNSKAHGKVFFDKLTKIASVDIGYLSGPSSWIFPPRSIKISTSKDGKIFNQKEVVEIEPLNDFENASIKSIIIPVNEKVIAIELEIENESQIPSWHEGKGKKGWLFMDEWIFN